MSLLWRHKKKRWRTEVTTESKNRKEKDKREQEQNEWIKWRWTITNARGWGKITLGGDKWMQTCNPRSGSIFVSLWKLHSGGQGETKSSSRWRECMRTAKIGPDLRLADLNWLDHGTYKMMVIFSVNSNFRDNSIQILRTSPHTKIFCTESLGLGAICHTTKLIIAISYFGIFKLF